MRKNYNRGAWIGLESLGWSQLTLKVSVMVLAYNPSVSRQRQKGAWTSLASQSASSRPVSKPITMEEHNVSDIDIWGHTAACTCKCVSPQEYVHTREHTHLCKNIRAEMVKVISYRNSSGHKSNHANRHMKSKATNFINVFLSCIQNLHGKGSEIFLQLFLENSEGNYILVTTKGCWRI